MRRLSFWLCVLYLSIRQNQRHNIANITNFICFRKHIAIYTRTKQKKREEKWNQNVKCIIFAINSLAHHFRKVRTWKVIWNWVCYVMCMIYRIPDSTYVYAPLAISFKSIQGQISAKSTIYSDYSMLLWVASDLIKIDFIVGITWRTAV